MSRSGVDNHHSHTRSCQVKIVDTMDQRSPSKFSRYLTQLTVGRSAVKMIIQLNVVVFILWFLLGFTFPTFMLENFLVSWDALMQGRVWTLITSVFSHNMFWHIFVNMYVLYSFGNAMEMILGFGQFLKFYLFAGAFSSLCHTVVSAWLLRQPEIPALGASGAISAVIILFALIFPKRKIFIFGLIPVPALSGAVAFAALDLWGLISQTRGSSLPIGYGAHLGGVLFGTVYYFVQRHRLRVFD